MFGVTDYGSSNKSPINLHVVLPECDNMPWQRLNRVYASNQMHLYLTCSIT